MKTAKTNGGVSRHAVKRLTQQLNHFGFKGKEGEARKLLLACRQIGDKNGFITLPNAELANYGINKRLLKIWGIDGLKIIVCFSDGVVTTELGGKIGLITLR